jgi:hypothetical protein
LDWAGGHAVNKRMIFDLGANESMLTPDNIAALRLPFHGVVRVYTAAGPVLIPQFGPVTLRIKVDKYYRRWWCLWLCKTQTEEERQCQLVRVARGPTDLLGTDALLACGLKLEVDSRNLTAELIAPGP